MIRNAVVCALVAAAGSAVAAPTFVNAGDLTDGVGGKIEARFKADFTNWDSRLENDGFPIANDNQAGVANGSGSFDGVNYQFSLTHTAANTGAEFEWTITRPDSSTVSLTHTSSGLINPNTIQFFTSGSRGVVDVENLAFTGLGMDVNAWVDVDTAPSGLGGPTFADSFLFFGNGFDLLSGDWTLAGDVTFSDFTNSNPNEGAKITAKVFNAVPAPATAGVLALAGLAARRRR